MKEVREVRESREETYKGSVPELPDINVRPSSKRKLILKKTDAPSVPTTTSATTALKSTLLRRADSKSKKPS